METTLAHTPRLASERYSLADVAATPYVNGAELGAWIVCGSAAGRMSR